MSYQSIIPPLSFKGIAVTSYFTSSYSNEYMPWFSVDPNSKLIDSSQNNQWRTYPDDNQKISFVMKYNSPIVAERIYYENSHDGGKNTWAGWKEVSLWGSNLNDTVSYNDKSEQTLIWEGLFDIHINKNIADPKYITINNSEPYKYYHFRIEKPHRIGLNSFICIRHIALQIFV